MTRVHVRRERPSAAAWAMALVVTMLILYVLTLDASRPDVVESVSAEPRVTRRIEFEAMERWCVSMGRFEDAGRARIEAAGSVSGGGAGLVQAVDGGWQVLSAMVGSEREARRLAAQLKSDTGAEAEAVRLDCEAVTVQITAPERQIDAIAGAEQALRGQIDQLDTLARQLDRGEQRPDGARMLCALAATEIRQAGENLARTPGAAENRLCATLLESLDALAGQLDAISASGQAAASSLSGMARLAGIDTYLRLRALRQALLEEAK